MTTSFREADSVSNDTDRPIDEGNESNELETMEDTKPQHEGREPGELETIENTKLQHEGREPGELGTVEDTKPKHEGREPGELGTVEDTKPKHEGRESDELETIENTKLQHEGREPGELGTVEDTKPQHEGRESDELGTVEDTKLQHEHVDVDVTCDHKIEINSASAQQQSHENNSSVGLEEEKQVAQENPTISVVKRVHSNAVVHPSTNHLRPLSRTIHILGSGNIGKLVAHSLAGLTEPPPITLLLHRPSLLDQWYDEGEAIELVTGQTSVVRHGFSAELVGRPETDQELAYPELSGHLFNSTVPTEDLIDNLIVTTKAAFTVPALLSISRRLHSGSTICFIQNGMGIIEDVSKHVFPDLANRPRYMAATISHGVAPHDVRQFTAYHNGVGAISLSVTPIMHSGSQGEEQSFVRRSTTWTNSTLYLARVMTRPTLLDVRGYPYLEFIQGQLEKLAVNCVINPLTTMLDCTNGELLYNFSATRSFRKILQEFCLVVRNLPELHGIEGVPNRFRKGLLEKRVISIAEKTSTNTSSMLQDVRKGRKTEIDYINGYIANRALQLDVPCPVNSFVVQMIKAKQAIKDRDINDFVPFDEQKREW